MSYLARNKHIDGTSRNKEVGICGSNPRPLSSLSCYECANDLYQTGVLQIDC